MIITDDIIKRRNGKLTRVGVLLGLVIDNEIRIGFSLCSKEDDFDYEYGLALAGIRALSPEADECPESILPEVVEFAKKCRVFFPSATLYRLKEETRTYPLDMSCIVEVF